MLRTQAAAVVAASLEAEREAPPDAVLLFDGVFCQRPELLPSWDLRIFLDVPFAETLRRMLVRDRSAATPEPEAVRRFWARYAPGQALYLAEARPRDRAHLLIDNTDPAAPCLLREHALV